MATTPQSIPPLAKQGWYKRNEIAVTPWLFLVPGLIMFAIYVIFPIFQSFRISLYKWDGLGTLATHADYVGLANFEKLLTRDRAFNTSLWNNLKWLIFYLAAIPAGLFIALFLNQTVRGIRLYKSLFFFPFVISQIVVGLVFTWFYDPQYGLFNGIIGFMGFEPINVLGDPTLSTYGIIAAGIWP
ncbi:MAG: sugar ABC transporter permease, partial [Rhodobacteraceae bacterium]|nr:sugar ABC transporter permease [Paracoccaceae bacterium]